MLSIAYGTTLIYTTDTVCLSRPQAVDVCQLHISTCIRDVATTVLQLVANINSR